MADLRIGGRCQRHPLNILPCSACGTVAANKELAARLRALATGRVEWRVADPITGAIAIWFDHTDGHDPERRAREWLETIRANHPGSAHARKEVVRAVVFSQLEQAALDAAAALDPDGVDVPVGWLYEFTHSSALGKPDEHITAFTTDESRARQHDNARPVYGAPTSAQRDRAIIRTAWEFAGASKWIDEDIIAAILAATNGVGGTDGR